MQNDAAWPPRFTPDPFVGPIASVKCLMNCLSGGMSVLICVLLACPPLILGLGLAKLHSVLSTVS